MHFCRMSLHRAAGSCRCGAGSLWDGIVSARLSDIASALETTPEEVLDRMEAEGIEPMLDTADPATQMLMEEGWGGRVLVASSVG
jgi:hypothetical protein